MEPIKGRGNLRINSCDVVVWSKLEGKVTCGVGNEVNYALEQGKKVFQIDNKKALLKRTKRKIKHLTLKETMALYYGTKVRTLTWKF